MADDSDPRHFISLCFQVYQMGYVDEETYRIDVEQSKIFPESIRETYYSLSETMVKYAWQGFPWDMLFFGAAYWYLHAINGIHFAKKLDVRAWMLLAWVPFVLWLPFVLFFGYLLNKTDKKDSNNA